MRCPRGQVRLGATGRSIAANATPHVVAVDGYPPLTDVVFRSAIEKAGEIHDDGGSRSRRTSDPLPTRLRPGGGTLATKTARFISPPLSLELDQPDRVLFELVAYQAVVASATDLIHACGRRVLGPQPGVDRPSSHHRRDPDQFEFGGTVSESPAPAGPSSRERIVGNRIKGETLLAESWDGFCHRLSMH